MKRLSIILVIIGLTGTVSAQETLYKVLACQGDSHLRHGMEVRKVIQGTAIFPQEELILSRDAYVALLSGDGTTIELRGENTYTSQDLAKGRRTAGEVWKYADFLLGKMSAENKKNRLSNTGYLTERGHEEGQRLHMFIPSMVKVFDTRVLLRWPSMGQGEYAVRISDMYESELYTTKTSENALLLDLDRKDLAAKNIVLVSVSVDGQPEYASETYALKRLPDEQVDEVSRDLNAISHGNTAPDHLIRAAYFEENNLLADALTSYVRAMESAPDIAAYAEVYEEFLLRNHLVRF